MDDIEAAFATVVRPDDADMFTPNMLPGDLQKAKEVFVSQSRDNIALGQVDGDADLIFFMRPEAFVYFLPRLMTLCLSEPAQALNLFDKLEYMFLSDRRSATYMDDYHQRLDSLLSEGMRSAIRRFLDEFMSRNPEAGPPSGDYWVR